VTPNGADFECGGTNGMMNSPIDGYCGLQKTLADPVTVQIFSMQ
jgi:hypothetical protein